MFYIFLLIVAVVAIGTYLLFIFNTVPEVRDQRLGVLEPLPDDLGKWKFDEGTPAAEAAKKQGLVREVRYFHYEGGGILSTGKLVKQARLRQGPGGEIVQVEPEEEVKRKRVRS